MKECSRCNEKIPFIFQKQIPEINKIFCPYCYNEIVLKINDWNHSKLALFEEKKWIKLTFEWNVKFTYRPPKDILLRYSHNIFILFLRVYKRSFAKSLGLDIPDVTNISNSKSKRESEIDELLKKEFDLKYEKIDNQTYRFIIFSNELFSVKDFLEQKFSINQANIFLCKENKINRKDDFSVLLYQDNEPAHKHIKGCLNYEYAIRNRIKYFLLDKESEDNFFEDQSFDNFMKKIDSYNFKNNIAKREEFVLQWINNSKRVYNYEKNLLREKLLEISKM